MEGRNPASPEVADGRGFGADGGSVAGIDLPSRQLLDARERLGHLTKNRFVHSAAEGSLWQSTWSCVIVFRLVLRTPGHDRALLAHGRPAAHDSTGAPAFFTGSRPAQILRSPGHLLVYSGDLPPLRPIR